MSQAQAVQQSKNPIDLFIAGARQGWNVAVTNMIPNILMAFVIIQILQITGLLKLIGKYGGLIMNLWGVPGEALVVIVTAVLSQGGAVGMAVSLHAEGLLSIPDIAVITPGCMLVGGMIQYVGRCLGTSGANQKYWGIHILLAVLNAAIGMWIMRFLATILF